MLPLYNRKMGTNWPATGAVPPLPEGAVHVWHLLAGKANLPQAHALLTPEEQARAARIRAGAPRHEFTVARAALRLLLGATLGEAPLQLHFQLGEHGKPSLAQGAVDFNVTHSGGCILIAISRAGAVGIDVEPLDRKVEAMELAAAHFHPEEVTAIAAETDEARRLALFFRCWTRKEAVVKADGRALQISLDEFCVLGDAPCNPVALPGRTPMWVQDIDAGPGYIAALAFPERDIPVVFHRFTALV